VNKAEPEDKNVPWDKQECGADADMDGNDLLSATGLYQVSDQI
jgi:hypothetical protein